MILYLLIVPGLVLADTPVLHKAVANVIPAHEVLDKYRAVPTSVADYNNRPHLDLSPDGRLAVVHDRGNGGDKPESGPVLAVVDFGTGAKTLTKVDHAVARPYFARDGTRVLLGVEHRGKTCVQPHLLPDWMPCGPPVARGKVVGMSPDRKWCVSVPNGAKGSLEVWDWETGRDISTLNRPEGVTLDEAAFFSRDGGTVAVPTEHKFVTDGGRESWLTAVSLYDVKTGKAVQRLINTPGRLGYQPKEPVTAADFSPDGRNLAVYGGTAGKDETLWLWSRKIETAYAEILPGENRRTAFTLVTYFDTKGKRLFLGGQRWGGFWDLESSSVVRWMEWPAWRPPVKPGTPPPTHHPNGWPVAKVVRYAATADGSRIALLKADGGVEVWKMRLADR